MPLFEVLLFPWAASYRALRANSLAAIGLSLLLMARLVMGMR
jgi:NADH:ubiquinone oxidoreductase subunit 3 (subunit A)